MILKISKKNYQAKKSFIVSWLIKNVSNKEYEHVLKVWNKFKIKTIKGYHKLYLKCDNLLLTDVFKKFRNSSLKNYRLCLSCYLSAPALSWDAILKMAKVEFEFISYADMYLFFIYSLFTYIYIYIYIYMRWCFLHF